MKLPIIIAALALAAPAVPAHAADRWVPEAGTRAYHFESSERVTGQDDHGVRLDYDLVSDGAGGLVAVVRAAQRIEAGKPVDVTVDDACRAKLHAGPGELARITLAPLAPEIVRSPGAAFIDSCAPDEIFGPVSEVLNATMIQIAPEFGLALLDQPGDSRRFAAYSTHVDRPNQVIDLDTPGGTTRFTSAKNGRATIDWFADTMALKLLIHGPDGTEIRGEGTGEFSISLDIDRATGFLIGARSLLSRADIILDIKDAPPIPIAVTREIRITLLP